MAKLDFVLELTKDEVKAIFHRLAHAENCDEEVNNILHEYKVDVSQLDFDVITTIVYCLKVLEGRK